MKSSKVFLGLYDIASFIQDWEKGLADNNYNTLKGLKSYQYKVQSSKVDFVIEKAKDMIGYFRPYRISTRLKPHWNRLVEKYYFRKAMRECEVFVFFWCSFNSDFSDFEILKSKGKKIITVFVGDDVRWEPAMKQEFILAGLMPIKYEDYDYTAAALNHQLNYLRIAEKYSDLILSHPNAMQLALRPYHNLNIPIILDDYNEDSFQREVPIIVHAPTSIGKGTSYIEAAIDQLLKEGVQLIYRRIENVPRKEALKIYEKADIIIDQVLTPGGGKLAHEGLAMGKIVITLMACEKYSQKKIIDCPFVDAGPTTIYEVLKRLVPDVAERVLIASRGRNYIETWHNPKIVISKILQHINGSKFMEPDFFPKFLRDEFVPESKEQLEVCNEWTKYVSDCEWYKRTITPGQRKGLNF